MSCMIANFQYRGNRSKIKPGRLFVALVFFDLILLLRLNRRAFKKLRFAVYSPHLFADMHPYFSEMIFSVPVRTPPPKSILMRIFDDIPFSCLEKLLLNIGVL